MVATQPSFQRTYSPSFISSALEEISHISHSIEHGGRTEADEEFLFDRSNADVHLLVVFLSIFFFFVWGRTDDQLPTHLPFSSYTHCAVNECTLSVCVAFLTTLFHISELDTHTQKKVCKTNRE